VKVLFDQGTPAPLRRELIGHSVSTAFEMGWSDLGNGDLIAAAEAAFDVLITTDQNLRYQQNLSARKLAVLVLPTTSWPVIRDHAAEVVTAMRELQPGDFLELVFSKRSSH
jgi:hypothetical protein